MNRILVHWLMRWHQWRLACAEGAHRHHLARLERLAQVRFESQMRTFVKPPRRL